MEEFYTSARGEGHRELVTPVNGKRRISASPPARCFQVDREILAAAHPWDCVPSALYESRVIRSEG
jgi:hypothetical protein